MKSWWAVWMGMGAVTWGQLAAEPWTLERAMEQARTNSPDARIAGHRIRAARAVLQQAHAGFMPHLQFNASYLQTDNPMLVLGSVLNHGEFGDWFARGRLLDPDAEADNLNLNGVVRVPLYAGGQNQAIRRAAEAGSEAALQAAEAVRQVLAFEVARAFYTVHKSRAFIRATEAGVQAFESSLGIARKRYQTGTALKHEVLDVEVRLAQAREDAVRARNAHALALRALSNLLGIEDPDFTVAETCPMPVPPGPAEKAVRPELIVAAWQTRMAEHEVRRALGGFLPRVEAYARYDYDDGWKLEGSGESYAAGVQLQWDLWDGDRTRGRVREARARLEAAREEERKLRLALELERQQAQLFWQEVEERLAVTDKAVAQAEESTQLTRARFEQGLALATQLIDAETALVAARVRRAESEADRRIAAAALRRASGVPLFPALPPQP